jgi:hypothetical protein
VLRGYIEECNFSPQSFIDAEANLEKTCEGLAGGVKDKQCDAYALYLDAKEHWTTMLHAHYEMTVGAYEQVRKLTKFEEEHGLHVRILVTGLKHHGLWQ